MIRILNTREYVRIWNEAFDQFWYQSLACTCWWNVKRMLVPYSFRACNRTSRVRILWFPVIYGGQIALRYRRMLALNYARFVVTRIFRKVAGRFVKRREYVPNKNILHFLTHKLADYFYIQGMILDLLIYTKKI